VPIGPASNGFIDPDPGSALGPAAFGLIQSSPTGVPALLVWDNTSLNPQAHRLIDGVRLESVQLGGQTGFPSAVIDLSFGTPPHNRIVEFLGDLYLLHRGTVYKFNFGSKLWVTTGFTLTSPPLSDDQAMSGLHVMDVAGQAALVGVYVRSGSSSGGAFWSFDGSSWNQSTNTNLSASWPRFTLPYQGLLWACGGTDGEEVYNYNFDTDTFSFFAITGTVAPRNGQLINFQGRLFWVGTNFSGGLRQPVLFKELVGGSFVDVTYSGGANPGLMVTLDTQSAGSFTIFGDAGRMYVVFWNMDDNLTLGQMACHEFVPNGTAPGSTLQENDISATVIPAEWLTGGANENLGSLSTQCNGYVNTSDPTSHEIYWWRLNDGNSVVSTFWRWNGNAALCDVANSVLGRTFAFPMGPNTQSNRLYTEGEFDVTLENAQISPGKITFDFQAHLPLDGSSPPNKQARLYYSSGGSGWTQATLHASAPTVVSGGDAAPTIGGNLLQGIVVGASKFQAGWDAIADGFTGSAQEAELLLEVF